MLSKRFAFLLPLLLLLSCQQLVQTNGGTVNFSITSPRADWVYYENNKIMLAVNVDTDDIIWKSSVSGYLGEGNHLTLFLPEGLHGISAEIRGVQKERTVYINPFSETEQSRSILVHYTPLDVKIKNGYYYPYLYSNDGTVNDFSILPTPLVKVLPYENRRVLSAEPDESPMVFPLRDTRLPMPKAGICISSGNNNYRIRSARSSNSLDTNRTFYVINTQNQYGLPHELEAELWYQSDTLSVWLPVASGLPGTLLDRCIQNVETIIMPRVYSLWGKPADIDGDNRIALLFSNTLNEEGLALGFFNPGDFFERNSDNPSSNEMDIIYAAFPDDVQDSSYYINNVIATIAHELTHASTFTLKTWSRIQNGDADAAREALFLDEGWSHLSENLCGFGISGGNIKFLNRFFENTSMYSFCGANRNGQEDSAGMRGAMTLFLSWLFWKKGGMSWDSANPVNLIDRGGIAFLQRMAASAETGWESIGSAFGKPVQPLFNEMLNEINNYRILNREYNYTADPLTNEAVDFFVNMGPGIIEAGFPKTSSAFSGATLLPWSFVCFEPMDINNDSIIILNAHKNNGSIVFTF